jgi:D-alanine-D-alanine ligase
MHRIRVGVLRGGPSDEYEVSLKTGASVLNNLSQEKYNPVDILIDRKGIWHVGGKPVKQFEALAHVDIVFNALHGNFGEDGKLQHILENHHVKFTGSKSFASALGMNKTMSKEVYNKNKIKTPLYRTVDKNENSEIDIEKIINQIFHTFPLPIVIKPVSSGSSVGVSIINDYRLLKDALDTAFKHSDSVMIEEYIKGKEATCGVIDNFRDCEFYTLPPIEIRPHNGKLFDFEAKYEGKSDEIVPGNFSEEEKKEIERLAIEAHKALGLRHYSRSDFIIHPKRGIFILESNTLPGLTDESLLPKALHSVGASLSHFLDHIVGLAISGR